MTVASTILRSTESVVDSIAVIDHRVRIDQAIKIPIREEMNIQKEIRHQFAPVRIAVWIVRRTSLDVAQNTNAVVVDRQDPDALRIVRGLTRGRAVLLTAGSTAEGLPLVFPPLDLDDLEGFGREIGETRELVRGAVEAYAWGPTTTGGPRRSRRKIVVPDFPDCPSIRPLYAIDGSPIDRALATANLVCRMWMAWLDTESERCKRARKPNGKAWMMPEGLGDPEVRSLPENFSTRVQVEPHS